MSSAECRDCRYVFDTNVIISAVLFNASVPGQVFTRALEEGTILISCSLVEELEEVFGVTVHGIPPRTGAKLATLAVWALAPVVLNQLFLGTVASAKTANFQRFVSIRPCSRERLLFGRKKI